MDLKSHSHRTGETGNSPVYPVDSVVSMNYAIFYKENDIPKVTLVDSLQDTEDLMKETEVSESELLLHRIRLRTTSSL